MPCVTLQRVGGLAGLKLCGDTCSCAAKMQRLRRAILGHNQRPGLVKTSRSMPTAYWIGTSVG